MTQKSDEFVPWSVLYERALTVARTCREYVKVLDVPDEVVQKALHHSGRVTDLGEAREFLLEAEQGIPLFRSGGMIGMVDWRSEMDAMDVRLQKLTGTGEDLLRFLEEYGIE